MSLSIEIRRFENIVILDLAGRVSVLDLSIKLLAAKLIESGELYFVINLANVSYIDNFGLGQLCWIYTVARNRGGDMKLVRPTERIKKMLSITKLDTVFESFEDEADALAAIGVQAIPFSITANGY